MLFNSEIPDEPSEDHKDFVPIAQYKALQRSLFESQVSSLKCRMYLSQLLQLLVCFEVMNKFENCTCFLSSGKSQRII